MRATPRATAQNADRLDPRLVAVAIAPVGAGVLPVFLTGAMAVQISASLGFGEAGLGLASGSFFAAGAATSALLGRRAERSGAIRAMRFAIVGSGLCLAAIAALATSLWSLVALLMASGVANSLAQPAANLFLAEAMPAGRRGLAFGLKQSAIPAGTLLGGLAVPAIALTAGWRWGFAAGAVLAAAALAVVLSTGAPAAAVSIDAGRPGRSVYLAAVGIGFGSASAGMLAAFGTVGGVQAGLGQGAAGLLVAASALLSMTVRLALGARADRTRATSGDSLRLVSKMLAGGAAGFVALAASAGGGTVTALFVVGLPVTFGLGWAWPGLFNLAVVTANLDGPAAATGVTQTGIYIGAVAGPLVFGAVASASYSAAWMVGAACALIAAALIRQVERAEWAVDGQTQP